MTNLRKPKILFICLSSYIPSFRDSNDLDFLDRQELYGTALWQLGRLIKSNLDFDCEAIVIDNTVSSLSSLSSSLQFQLRQDFIKDVLLINDNNLGSANKGAGEYLMCQALLSKHSDYLVSFDWVIYYTSRHLIFSNLIFNYLRLSPECDALVSNTEYILSGGKIGPTGGNFDDVIFIMRPECFSAYIHSTDTELLVKNKIGSEAHLFNFLTSSSFNYQMVYRWGLLRYDYGLHKSEII